ncbi:hypothetical protein D9756_006504 [Leucocoprinus leucothites]|uniref:Uncharacterized protein n=1 Tax=Leucocoprinus leucothites TaxID=201217 RepID=A0A8H5G2A8_9AGAR|nr:hypothetical protein D9756_006504 [Leucoagaricus leucothites]
MLPENHLSAPRRSSVRPTSPNTRPRSISPGGRSSVSGRPPSSYAPFHPHVPSKLGPSRPQTPPGPPHSLRPIASRASMRSRISNRLGGLSAVTPEPEPEPLPIIEPVDLPEQFADPEERVWPAAPEGVYRYDRRIFASRKAKDVVLKPMTMRFEPPWNPAGWQPIIHPEGQMYFWHSEKRVITEAYLYDRVIFEHLVRHLAKLEEFIERLGLRRTLAPHDLVVDLQPHEEGGYYCGYYFANHQERTIFWLQYYYASNLRDWSPEAGHKSKLHLKHAIETQYWRHCELYPTTLNLKIEHVSEIRDILLHYIADSMLSPEFSIAPYTHEDLNRMLGWVNSLKKNIDTASIGSACMLARLMNVFVRERFVHFYGEPAVRLLRGASVYGTIRRRTLLIRLVSPILFAAPLQHLKALERIWVDDIVHEPTWKVLINKFNKQWEEFILFATVMLNANMALLAIQSIDELRFLDERVSKVVGLEMLAILYSLPFAFLMWGMIGFLCAFCFICFQGTTPVTRGIIGAASLLTGFTVVWCIWIGWDKTIHLQPQDLGPTMTIADLDYGNETESEHNHSVRGSASYHGSNSDRASGHRQETTNPDLGSIAGYKQIWTQLGNSWKKFWSDPKLRRTPATSSDVELTGPGV